MNLKGMSIMRMTYREGLRQALRESLTNDPRVFLMGEDVGAYGGSYAVSKGLLSEFGPERIRDTPLSEGGFLGAGIGAALGGLRPIIEIMTVNFSLLALDQIINSAAMIRHMSGGQFTLPIVIRMTTGGGRQLAAQHSNSLEGWYAHIPGLKILTPATVADARYMLGEALLDNNPILIFEHALLLNQEDECVPKSSDYKLFQAAIRRTGSMLSLISSIYSGKIPWKDLSVALFFLALLAPAFFAFNLITNLLFDFFSRNYRAMANTRTECFDIFSPCFCIHNFRPERPSSALCWSCGINTAAFSF